MYRQALTLHEKVLGSENPRTRRCRNNLQSCVEAAKEGEDVSGKEDVK